VEGEITAEESKEIVKVMEEFEKTRDPVWMVTGRFSREDWEIVRRDEALLRRRFGMPPANWSTPTQDRLDRRMFKRYILHDLRVRRRAQIESKRMMRWWRTRQRQRASLATQYRNYLEMLLRETSIMEVVARDFLELAKEFNGIGFA
jgi:hypothetical protein